MKSDSPPRPAPPHLTSSFSVSLKASSDPYRENQTPDSVLASCIPVKASSSYYRHILASLSRLSAPPLLSSPLLLYQSLRFSPTSVFQARNFSLCWCVRVCLSSCRFVSWTVCACVCESLSNTGLYAALSGSLSVCVLLSGRLTFLAASMFFPSAF